MKVKVHLPYGYGRSVYTKDLHGRPIFARTSPMFDINMYADDGTNVTDAYPHTVRLGPDMYNLMNHIAPNIASRLGEDLQWEGDVDDGRSFLKKNKDLYGYFGYGDSPLEMRMMDHAVSIPEDAVHLIGVGKDPLPKSDFGTDYSGRPNFLYSKLLKEDDSDKSSKSKSAILTNILNLSQDFSPLFGPLYPFKDISYNPKAKTDVEEARKVMQKRYRLTDEQAAALPIDKIAIFMSKYAPRTTDHYVPKFNPDGTPVLTEKGEPLFIPIPLVQPTPFYNFKHPMYEKDPQAAWDMMKDYKSAMSNWSSLGSAPSFAEWTGVPSMTAKGVIRPINYNAEYSRKAVKPGYFTELRINGDDKPHVKVIKKSGDVLERNVPTGVGRFANDTEARENYLQVKADAKQAQRRDAIEKQTLANMKEDSAKVSEDELLKQLTTGEGRRKWRVLADLTAKRLSSELGFDRERAKEIAKKAFNHAVTDKNVLKYKSMLDASSGDNDAHDAVGRTLIYDALNADPDKRNYTDLFDSLSANKAF